MKRLLNITLFVSISLLLSCEKAVFNGDDDGGGNVTLNFSASNADPTRAAYDSGGRSTRATVSIGDYFEKLNVMLFDSRGEKVFDKVKTQLRGDEGFGSLQVALSKGTYTVVAVGHSSIKSATIKSPEMVQFTASDGEKLTDTFCYCGQVTIGDSPEQFNLTMRRVAAMFRVVLTDETVPDNVATMRFDYTGGSANFNPSTFEGTTKSTQSETRSYDGLTYCCFTFPYMAASCQLKMTLSALDASGTTIRKRTWEGVTVTRNRITTYTGHFFQPGDGQFTQAGFGFTVDADWDGEQTVDF